MIELYARVAQLKFIASGVASSMPEAIELLLTQHVLPRASRLDTMGFRRDMLYRSEIEQAFLPFIDPLTFLFTRYTKKHIGVKRKPHMDLKEFAFFFTMADFVDKSFTVQNLHFIFNASRMMVVDEMDDRTTHKYKFLTWTDFLEALARMALAKSNFDVVAAKLSLGGTIDFGGGGGTAPQLSRKLPVVLSLLLAMIEKNRDDCRGKLKSGRFTRLIESALVFEETARQAVVTEGSSVGSGSRPGSAHSSRSGGGHSRPSSASRSRPSSASARRPASASRVRQIGGSEKPASE